MMQEFVQSLEEMMTANINNIHTCFPAKIVSFDTSTGLAKIQPSLKYKKGDGTTMKYPEVSGVPVVIPQSNNQDAVFAYPVKAGDGCLVVISEQSIEDWLYGQETVTDLNFDITNAIAIVGMFNKISPYLKEATDENAIIARVGNSKLKLKKDISTLTVGSSVLTVKPSETILQTGSFKVNCSSMQVNSSGAVDINGSRIDLN